MKWLPGSAWVTGRPLLRQARRALILAAVSAVARIPAFLIPILIAAFFGAGHQTDAYFIAYSAVLFLGGTLAQGIEPAVVPFAAGEIHRYPSSARSYLDRAARYSAATAMGLWGICVPILVVLTDAGLRITVVYYVATFTALPVAWAAAAVFTGALISQWRIAGATASMLWRGTGALLGAATVPFGGGLGAIALGLAGGEVVRVLWLRRTLFRPLPASAAEPITPVGPLARAAIAQVLASAAIGAAPVAERFIAASLGVGAVSHLEYALRLLVIPSLLFEGALFPLILARWSHQAATSPHPPASKDVLRLTVLAMAGAAIVGGVLLVSAPWVVHILLGHGRFTSQDELAVSNVLRLLSFAYVANMGAQVIERRYIAVSQNRVLARLSIVRATLRVGLMWLLLPRLGLRGFAVGFAVSDWTYLLALLTRLGRQMPGPEPKGHVA